MSGQTLTEDLNSKMIRFPAYILSEEPEEIDGLLIIADQVVDDRNMSGADSRHEKITKPYEKYLSTSLSD